MSKPYLSALIPVYNEEENLPKLGEEVSAALDALGKPYEVILVDDGSKDNSYNELLKLVARYPNFKTVRFARNAGQTAAMLAGIQHASGEVIVCLDADMQNDARDIPKLLAKLDEGYDVVSGWRRDRQDRFLDRKLPSMIANGMISKVTGVQLHASSPPWPASSAPASRKSPSTTAREPPASASMGFPAPSRSCSTS
jgi:glycosyltransferase involved in cell wall biosynthesis